MKWIYDSSLITRQIIAWAFLIGIWGVLIYFVIKLVPPQFVAIVLGIIAIPIIWQFFFSHRAVLRSMGAQIITKEQDPRLYYMVKKLAKQADLPMPKIAIVNTTMPNAFATGRSKNHSVVAVTRGLYSYLNDEELEAVIAHELSHVKNADMATLTITTFLSTVALLLIMALSACADNSNTSNDDDGIAALGQALFLIIGFVIAGLLYLLTSILMNLLSRYRELAADRGSVLITGNGEALISALTKIEHGVSVTPRREIPESSSCNMYYIIPAVTSHSFFNLFSTHPTLEKRIRNIRQFTQMQQHTILENREQYQKIAEKMPQTNTQIPRSVPQQPAVTENRQWDAGKGKQFYREAIEMMIGTATVAPNHHAGLRYMNLAANMYHYAPAEKILESSDREAALYLAGARLKNEIALKKVAEWYSTDRTRIPKETWREYDDVVFAITHRRR